MGIIPCRFTTLDMLRVESYLLFYPYDNSQKYPFADEGPGDTLWELGLDFTVSPGKTGFRGAEEHYRLKGKERFKIFGVLLDGQGAGRRGRAGLCRRQAGRRRHLRHVFAAGQEIDGHRAAFGRHCGRRHAARDPQQERHDQGDGAAAALRRSEEDQAQRERLTANDDGDRPGAMIEPTIKSRPVYGTLTPQPGKDHLFVADAEGAAAILDLAKAAPEGFFAGAEIVFIPRATGDRYTGPLQALAPGALL